MPNETLKDKLTMTVHTCDKYSDLWEGHFKLLNQNWPDRGIETLLVTDAHTDRTFDGVRVISTGDGLELSERVAAVLPQIKTEYILFALDDYYPIYPISTAKIERLIDIMDREGLDYVRLFKYPNSRKRLPGYKNLYQVSLTRNYAVNLFQGIWRKSFLEKTVKNPKNAWMYEVSLTKIAADCGAKCVQSKGNEYPILDIVSKGKILHKGKRYFKRNPIYHGNRETMPIKEEMRAFILNSAKTILPYRFINYTRNVMRRHGHRFFSDSSGLNNGKGE